MRERVAVACALVQFLLAFAFGAWALSGFDDPRGSWMLAGAAGLGVALGAAHLVTQGSRLIAALVRLMLAAPRVVRRGANGPAGVPAGPAAREPAVSWLSVALHTAALLASAQLLALVLALASDHIAWPDIAWRLALAALALVPLTRRALEVMWPES